MKFNISEDAKGKFHEELGGQNIRFYVDRKS